MLLEVTPLRLEPLDLRFRLLDLLWTDAAQQRAQLALRLREIVGGRSRRFFLVFEFRSRNETVGEQAPEPGQPGLRIPELIGSPGNGRFGDFDVAWVGTRLEHRELGPRLSEIRLGLPELGERVLGRKTRDHITRADAVPLVHVDLVDDPLHRTAHIRVPAGEDVDCPRYPQLPGDQEEQSTRRRQRRPRQPAPP